MPSKKTLTLMGAIVIAVSGFLTSGAAVFAASKEKVLYSFTGGTDGGLPVAGLIIDAFGNLYGTTDIGGVNNVGTVFELTPGANDAWTETVLYSFQENGHDGRYPQASLIFDAAGNLYGTTYDGGVNNVGTVFELTPGSSGTWTETVLYSFQNNSQDGANPSANLVFDAAGNLYGTTMFGGPIRTGKCNGGCGTVFELTPGSNGTWTEKVLHFFDWWDGATPWDGLVVGPSGSLYGTTSYGNVQGNVFRLRADANGKWTEKALHIFHSGDGDEGDAPRAPVIFDAAGNLYGAALNSYGYSGGTVFKLKHGTWTEDVLYSFPSSGQDGSNPYAGLIFDRNGNLYGTTEAGGADGSGCGNSGCGTVFRLKHGTWTEEVLHSFTGGSDGAGTT
jgi:uncharacterized repeat protein (TIGR03803 family)